MRKRILLVLLTAAGSMTACKQFIAEPDQSIITSQETFATVKDLDNVLWGAYGAVASGHTLAGNWKIVPEVLADHLVMNTVEVTSDDPYKELYDREMEKAQYPESWRLGYTAVQNANHVLYAIENGKITDPAFTGTVSNRFKGEAHFIRGLVYFELVRLYGHQWGYQSDIPQTGVIIRDNPVLNVTSRADIPALGRSSVAEVYAFVIRDFQEAERLLPAANTRGRATSYAAAAYLARVYFQQNDYAQALIQINKVLGATPGSIETDFKLVRNTGVATAANVTAPFTASGVGAAVVTENIVELIGVTNNQISQRLNKKYRYDRNNPPHFAVSPAFLTQAGFAANDLRRTALLTTVGSNTFTKKYDVVNMNIPVIRSAELVLDRAEINALQNNPADAVRDLNLIRDRAIPNYAALDPANPPANLLEEVRRERVRELAFEGDRLHNLRRLQRDIPGNRGVPWNSNRLLLKIPDAEIRANPAVVQNPD